MPMLLQRCDGLIAAGLAGASNSSHVTCCSQYLPNLGVGQSLTAARKREEKPVTFAPIFVVGVPRSGTTLLRVLLDSHSDILALPETPWLTGAYGRDPSLREMLRGLSEGPFGMVQNVAGVEAEDVLAAGRQFLESLFAPVLAKRGKRVLAFKTPADIRHLDFLTRLAPGGSYIHITRDGRDVALSQVAKKGSFFKDLREYRRLSFGNAFRRWVDWEQRARDIFAREGVRVIRLRYEDLVTEPRRELKRIMDFLSLPFEETMLNYASMNHDLPAWEAGSTDVAQSEAVSAASVGKWRRIRMTTDMLCTLMRYDPVLVEFGYAPTNLAPNLFERTFAAAYPFLDSILDAIASMPRPTRVSRWMGLAR